MKYLTFLTLLGAFVSSAQTKFLTTEPNHSTIGFEVPISGGITIVTGKFMEFDLKMTYEAGDWEKSKIDFTIQAGSIDTGIAERDDHLRSSDFFNVDSFPTIRFESKRIASLGEQKFMATGNFTMHGVTREIELPFEVMGEDGNTVSIRIITSINRIEYQVGHNWQHSAESNFLGDEINVRIFLWTKKDKRAG